MGSHTSWTPGCRFDSTRRANPPTPRRKPASTWMTGTYSLRGTATATTTKVAREASVCPLHAAEFRQVDSVAVPPAGRAPAVRQLTLGAHGRGHTPRSQPASGSCLPNCYASRAVEKPASSRFEGCEQRTAGSDRPAMTADPGPSGHLVKETEYSNVVHRLVLRGAEPSVRGSFDPASRCAHHRRGAAWPLVSTTS